MSHVELLTSLRRCLLPPRPAEWEGCCGEGCTECTKECCTDRREWTARIANQVRLPPDRCADSWADSWADSCADRCLIIVLTDVLTDALTVGLTVGLTDVLTVGLTDVPTIVLTDACHTLHPSAQAEEGLGRARGLCGCYPYP